MTIQCLISLIFKIKKKSSIKHVIKSLLLPYHSFSPASSFWCLKLFCITPSFLLPFTESFLSPDYYNFLRYFIKHTIIFSCNYNTGVSSVAGFLWLSITLVVCKLLKLLAIPGCFICSLVLLTSFLAMQRVPVYSHFISSESFPILKSVICIISRLLVFAVMYMPSVICVT